MAESKYSKYIITEAKTDLNLPSYRGESKAVPTGSRSMPSRLFWLDSDVIPGAFYSECVWIWPECASATRVAAKAHTHPFTEIVTFFGTNPDDPRDLCGEVEFWIEDEKHVMTTSFMAYIPAGMKHCPLIARRVDRPIFHFTIGPGKQYT
jgi:hypothetical protein